MNNPDPTGRPSSADRDYQAAQALHRDHPLSVSLAALNHDIARAESSQPAPAGAGHDFDPLGTFLDALDPPTAGTAAAEVAEVADDTDVDDF